MQSIQNIPDDEIKWDVESWNTIQPLSKKEGMKHIYPGFARLLKYQTHHVALQISNFLSYELHSQPCRSMVIMKFPLLNKLHIFEKDLYKNI